MRYNAEVRNEILREYRVSGEAQKTFCARTGIPCRTLRAWLAESRPESLSVRAADTVQKAIAELEEIRRTMEAALSSRHGGDPCHGGPEPTESGAGRQRASAAKMVEDGCVVEDKASHAINVASPVPGGDPSTFGSLNDGKRQLVVPLASAAEEHVTNSPLLVDGERQIAAAAEYAAPPAKTRKSFFCDIDWEA
jgi:hypothetical protein